MKAYVASLLASKHVKLQSYLFMDFATSESCIGDAPPRMKVGLLLTFRAYQATFMGVSILVQ
jgi:hypothetical protein